MSRRHLIALAIVVAALADPAAAELRGSPDGPPVFTSGETRVIARNAALSSLMRSDPWVVRRLLDALAIVDASRAVVDAPKPDTKDLGARIPSPAKPPQEAFDPRKNPDLDRLQRASPEAVLDLFQLLKQAGSPKPQTTR